MHDYSGAICIVDGVNFLEQVEDIETVERQPVMIYIISYIQSYFPPERTKKIIVGIQGIKGNILGALLGILTPFCSCSSIPIFVGFVSAGLPLGAIFSFLIYSK